MTDAKNGQTPEDVKTLIVQSLDADKAEDIVIIDLKNKTSIADYMVIASARSSRQAAGLVNKLSDRLAEAGVKPIHVEGQEQGDWVLLDAGDVIVHVFRPEVREFYNIEDIWGMDPPSPDDMAYISAS